MLAFTSIISLAFASLALAAPTIDAGSVDPLSITSTLISASPVSGPLANATGFYMSSSLDKSGGISITNDPSKALAVKFSLAGYMPYASHNAVYEMLSVNPGIEMPYVVINDDYSVTFGQSSAYMSAPTSSPTPSGTGMVESSVWFVGQGSDFLQAQYVTKEGKTVYLGVCYSWSNDVEEANHLKMVPLTYAGAHDCGQNYYALKIVGQQ